MNHLAGVRFPVILLAAGLAASPAFAADYYHLGGADVRIDQAAYYSNTDGSSTAATVAPGASDNLFFYNSLVAGPVNKTFELGATGKTYNSLTFGSNTGTLQFNRDTAGGTSTHLLGIGAGGITVESGAGPVTFGTTTQRLAVGAFEDYTIRNNSASALTFAREFDGRVFGTMSTVTVAGSGDGNTIFKSIKSYADTGSGARDLAMTINKTSGSGVVRFDGTNNNTGATTVLAGTLALGHATNTLFDTGVVTVDGAAAILSIAGNSDTVGAVSLKNGGSIIGSGGTLTGASYAVESGSVSAKLGGSGVLTKSTAGIVTLTGDNTYTGATDVTSGTLVVNGSIVTSSLTTVSSGATIGGSGTVGVLTVSSGGFINPGNSPGILNTGNYTQAGTYNAEITGLIAGISGHDQINVTGTVDITGGSLSTLFSGSTYTANDLIFILLNDSSDAITGTFTGLAQGATVTSYGGYDWIISYTADSTGTPSFSSVSGNDIALMAVAVIPEPNVAALIGGFGVLLILRRRR